MTQAVKFVLMSTLIVVALLTAAPHLAEAAAPTATLAVPSIVAPAHGQQITFEAQPIVFNWDAVSGAAGYHIQLSTDSAFSTTLVDVKPKSDGWASKTPINAGTYYWRIRARDSVSSGAWTTTRMLIIGAAASGGTPQPTPAPGGSPYLSPIALSVPYSASSVWNTPIPANPALDVKSSEMVALLGQTRNGGKIGSDTTQYTYPVYYVDASTPKVNVACVQYNCSIVSGTSRTAAPLLSVPVPPNAKASSGNDGQLIIIDVTTGTEWGFYHMTKLTDGTWTADNGYQYSVYEDGMATRIGSRGAGISYSAGLIRPWEIRQGHIDHAIAFAYEFTAAGKCVFPATKTDGKSTNPAAMPEGAHLQLNPALTDADFDRMGLSAAGKIVARALQKYGMILVDTSGAPKIMAENLGANVYTSETWSAVGYSTDVIHGLPYSEFRVLALPGGYWDGTAPINWNKCSK